jgi:hypothetical protein
MENNDVKNTVIIYEGDNGESDDSLGNPPFLRERYRSIDEEVFSYGEKN